MDEFFESHTDIESIFLVADSNDIVEFCKEYALKDNKFAESLFNRFFHFKGDTTEDRILNINLEIENCFSHNLAGSYKFKWGPYLDWFRIGNNLCGLIEKGKVMLKMGYTLECIHLAIEILRKISEYYIKDEVWNNTDYDGDCLGSSFALDLLSSIIKLEILNNEQIIKLKRDIKEISEMECNRSYGLINFGGLHIQCIAF